MKNYKTIFITLSILTIFFQGCGNSDNSTSTTVYPTAIGEAVSITTDEKNSVMTPSVHALEEVAKKMGKILKTEIEELNQKEAISFSKETNYCDISGEKTSITHGNLENFIKKISYKSCKIEELTQNGNIETTYTLTDSEGKYPKNIALLVTEDYAFNDMILKKELTVEGHIFYSEDKTLENISLKINGMVEFDHQTLSFKNFEQNVTP